MEEKDNLPDYYFSETELNEILQSFEQTEKGLSNEQLEKINQAWQKVKRDRLFGKQ